MLYVFRNYIMNHLFFIGYASVGNYFGILIPIIGSDLIIKDPI